MSTKKTKLLNALTIHSFRGLQNLVIAKLGDVNIFVGKNNCGKTSLLEALAFHCLSLQPNRLMEIFLQRGRLVSGYASDMQISWLFPHKLSLEEIATETEGQFPLSSLRAQLIKNEELTYETETLEETEQATDTLLRISLAYELRDGKQLKGDIDFKKLGPTSLRVSPPSPVKLPAIQYNFQFISVGALNGRRHMAQVIDCLTSIEGTPEKERLVSLLSYYDAGIQNVSVGAPGGERPCIFLSHNEMGQVPLFAFGDGFIRVFDLAMSAILAQGGVLLIDEIEAGLHYSTLKNCFSWLFRACRELDIQLFLSTHSLEVVDAASESVVAETELCCYHITRKDNNTYATIRYDRDKLDLLRGEYGSELR